MKQEELNKILEEHKLWLETRATDEVKVSRANLSYADLYNANLRDANLSYANLSCADLSYANLSGADLDFSCLPLWCGSLSANFDDRQLIQIAYHLVRAGLGSTNASNETKEELSKLIDFANKFHRVDECGECETFCKEE